MKKFVDALGDACPIPVVRTKNAIKDLGEEGGTVETLIDNEIAVQNLTKMAHQKGYEVKSEKLADNKYQVTMTIGQAEKAADNRNVTSRNIDKDKEAGRDIDRDKEAGKEIEAQEVSLPDSRKKNTLVVISSFCMGQGDDQLGAALMKGFIYAISQQDELPDTMLFYNGGAKLTCEDTPTLEDLKSLESQGVEIMTCGTCLNHYGLTDKLKVGTVTNMYVIAEKMSQATLIIKP